MTRLKRALTATTQVNVWFLALLIISNALSAIVGIHRWLTQ